jgi:hypothetical protein
MKSPRATRKVRPWQLKRSNGLAECAPLLTGGTTKLARLSCVGVCYRRKRSEWPLPPYLRMEFRTLPQSLDRVDVQRYVAESKRSVGRRGRVSDAVSPVMTVGCPDFHMRMQPRMGAPVAGFLQIFRAAPQKAACASAYSQVRAPYPGPQECGQLIRPKMTLPPRPL